jgi:hypothetical protein
MRKLTKVFLLASIIATVVAVSPALFAAQSDQEPSGSMTGHGMMGDGGTNRGGGMMGMGKMMKQMGQSQMMDHCSNMMSNDRPNDQWRRNSPSE